MTARRGVAYMAITAVLWSIGGVFIKMIPWHPMVLAGLRGLVAALVMALCQVLSKNRIRFDRKTTVQALFVCGTAISFIIANKLTTAANAIVLQYTAPIFLLLYSGLIRRQRFRPGDYVVVAATVGGIALFFFDQLSGGGMIGNLIGVLSGMGFAGTMIVTAGATDERRVNGLMQGHFFTALVGLPFVFFFPPTLGALPVAALFILGIFQLGLPYVLFAKAAGVCSALTCTLLSALEPMLNPVWVFLYNGEAPGPTALLGGAIVVASVTLWCVYDARKRIEAK